MGDERLSVTATAGDRLETSGAQLLVSGATGWAAAGVRAPALAARSGARRLLERRRRVTPSASTHSPHRELPSSPERSQTAKPGTAVAAHRRDLGSKPRGGARPLAGSRTRESASFRPAHARVCPRGRQPVFRGVAVGAPHLGLTMGLLARSDQATAPCVPPPGAARFGTTGSALASSELGRCTTPPRDSAESAAVRRAGRSKFR